MTPDERRARAYALYDNFHGKTLLIDELSILRDHRKESFVWGEDALEVKHHMNVESLQRLERLALKQVRREKR